MAKQALLDVLEKTIGKYVLNLDAESLNVAVWKGKIELSGLQLNCDNVNAELSRQAAEAPNLAIPFKVVDGEFANFQVDVPWAHLMSRSVVIRASGLRVVVEPYDRTASTDFLSLLTESEETRAQKIQQHRIKSLDMADEYRKQTNTLRELAEQDLEASNTASIKQKQQQASSSQQESNTFATRLVRRIIENLQIEINGVRVTVQGPDCAAGVMLNSLSLVTTDKDGIQTFVDRTNATSKPGSMIDNTFLYKAMQINGLGIYLDEDESKHLPSIEEEEGSLNDQTRHHSYVLAPLSFEAKLRQADSNDCIDFPKYKLQSELSSLSIFLSRTQMDLAQKIAQQIQPSNSVAARPLFPEYRPLRRVNKESAKDWWKYAFRCVGRLNGRRSWVEFFRAFQARKMYIPLYKRKAHSPDCSWMQPLTYSEETQLDEIERDRTISVEGIMAWRNVADAQARKEKEKYAEHQAKEKKSIFTSLFGSSTADKTKKEDAVDEPPIALTAEEMQELEAMAIEQANDELSSESRLCDLNFVMKSFRINLSTYNDRPLASLEMGTVSTAFDANQNGSFDFNLALSSLQVQDRITPNSLFPSVLKNQSSATTKDDDRGHAFQVHMSKNKTGDQELRVMLDTFEIVGSPILLSEVKQFLSTETPMASKKKANPLLAQSLSGSVDLFYDAADDEAPAIVGSPSELSTEPTAKMDDISNALIDAWKAKTASQTAWVMDFDIHAPIVVVPENCIEPRANVLVFDLGHFRLQYGTLNKSRKVHNWFEANPRPDATNVVPVLDNGSLMIDSLTFAIGKVRYWRRLVRKHGTERAPNDDEDIIQPISLSIEFGVESTTNEEIPRIYTAGVLPSISLRIAPSQLARILKVTTAWQKTWKNISPSEERNELEHEDDTASQASGLSKTRMLLTSPGVVQIVEKSMSKSKCTFSTLFLDFRLQQLALRILDEGEAGIEAHLVSVVATSSILSDGSSRSTLSMGWFWILDRSDQDFPRKQRLFAHSDLPLSADEFAVDDKYAILSELKDRGVFDEDFSGSTDLADVCFRQAAPRRSFGRKDPFEEPDGIAERCNVSSILDATFTSLHINWNPNAVKAMILMVGKLTKALSSKSEAGGIILSNPSQLSRRRGLSIDSSVKTPDKKSSETSALVINAVMDGLYVSLNSAKDDLPLFRGSMSTTKLSIVVSDDENTRLTLALGELVLATPEMGRTKSEFRTILGSTETQSQSFLSVRYFNGRKALAYCGASKEMIDGCEAYGEIELSKVRIVYIQAQVLALVEYSTAGILGALTAKAASSAAQAAAELAASKESKKVFCVRSSGVELLLPQAAWDAAYLLSSVGSLAVTYSALPDTSSETEVLLSDVSMQDSASGRLLEDRVRMDIKVILPPESVGTKDDQAMKVALSISKASFVISKKQYAQILLSLDQNIGEVDLMLRDDPELLAKSEKDSETDVLAVLGAGITHAGTEIVEEARRVCLKAEISDLSLSIFGLNEDDPLVRLQAVDSIIVLNTFPDIDKFSTQITLSDLVCDDLREKAITRQYRSLLYQAPSDSESHDVDVFVVSFEAKGDEESTIDIKVGSPRIVFIPDVISDVMNFLDVERKPKPTTSLPGPGPESSHEVVRIDPTEDSAIEASFVPEPKRGPVSSFSFRLSTDKCTVMLVDLGSNSLERRGGNADLPVSFSSVSETVVIGGKFTAKFWQKTDRDSGDIIALETVLHADEIEAYTAFGHELRSAVQMLDPTQLSIYLNFVERSTKVWDLRCAVTSPLDITLSMRNIALVNAVLVSISDCLEGDRDDNDGDISGALSPKEAERIEHLANILETDTGDASSHSRDPAQAASEPTEAVSEQELDKIGMSLKVTTADIKFTLINDLQGLDDALLRLTIRNLVANGRMQDHTETSQNALPFTAFDFNFHTSILSDYFDASTNEWKVLLLKPWEISLKSTRGISQRFETKRPSTTVDVESFPCHLSFSEQFLMSLASANRMWAVYSAASSSALESLDTSFHGSASLRKSMAASAARTFVSSLPYALENHSGVLVELSVSGVRQEPRGCESGSIEYFRFEPPMGNGSGGKRLYGQDVEFEKSISLFIEGKTIELPSIDSQLGAPKKSHAIGGSRIIVTEILREGKTIVVHVSSGVDVRNSTSVAFNVALFDGERLVQLGTCNSSDPEAPSGRRRPNRLFGGSDGQLCKESRRFGVPVDLTYRFRSEWTSKGDATLSLSFFPIIPRTHADWCWRGDTKLRVKKESFSTAYSDPVTNRFEITCRPFPDQNLSEEDSPRDMFAFVVQACVSMSLVDGNNPLVEVSLEPRAVVENKLPVSLTLKTPMPHVFSQTPISENEEDLSSHVIELNSHLEIFTPGPSIAVMFKCTDIPVGGTATEWMDGGWIDLPLVPEFRLHEPMECLFPFKKTNDPLALAGARGNEFVVGEGSAGIANLAFKGKTIDDETSLAADGHAVELAAPPSSDEDWRTFFVTVTNYAIDHTGDILFEQIVASGSASVRRSSSNPEKLRKSSVRVSQAQNAFVSQPFGAFSSKRHRGRISLLPGSNVPIRLLHLTMEGDEGLRRSSPFVIEDVSICDGGVDSSPIRWEDGTLSGFFAYRKFVSTYQSEVHVIPEFVVFNGSQKHSVCVRQPGGANLHIQPGQIAPLRTHSNETATITVEYPSLEAQTRPLRIDSLGLRVTVLRKNGLPIGRFALQTVVGAHDSRFVVKLGDIKHGAIGAPDQNEPSAYQIFKDDFLRFRIRWTELQMTLNEARPITNESETYIDKALDQVQKAVSPQSSSTPRGLKFQKTETWSEARERQRSAQGFGGQHENGSSDPICTILFERFTVDWQRIFKEDTSNSRKSARENLESPERSQLSVVIHNIRILDETPNSPFPIVFDSTSEVSFFDFCIRLRGDMDADMAKVDLVNLNLAHANGVCEKVFVNTSEDFVWKFLDLVDRILAAAAEFAGVDIQLEWDDEHDGYIVKVREKEVSSYLEDETKYEPPHSDKIYHIKKTRVSPFKLVVSFKRNPQTSRYKILQGVRGAGLMNYFTRQLKFKIEKAELSFGRYEVSDVKGPADRLVELLGTVYASRMKKKAVTLLTAASFQDWKFLAAREGGDDDYLEGDITRAAGNLAGRSVGLVFSTAGKGLGGGVSNVASTIGGGIETATDAIGVGALGAGVNSLVSGVGEGVGDTISGVGSGAGKVIKGAGKGVGHVLGGVTGGIQLVGKGAVQGITRGDGRAAASGLVQGVTSVGAGVGQGVESVVTGASEGVLQVGHGLFSGVKSIGKGIRGSVTEWCGCCCCGCIDSEEERRDGDRRDGPMTAPLLPQGNAAQPP